MRVDLNGKVALVTGAARNIGKAIADALAANGARVAYADIDLETAAQAAAASAGGTALRMDVTDQGEVEQGIAQVLGDLGRLDILVNNAGINTFLNRVTIEQFPFEEWERILKVDLDGLFLVSRAASQAMLRQKAGRIINIASVLGIVPARLQCAYVAAKAGVVNLTRAMAIELGPRGILVNCVAPGSVLTEGTKQLFYAPGGQFSDRVKTMLAHIPLGRPGTPDEIAQVVLFLAAPESSYVNGAIIPVDGGWLAGYIREF
ncbi:MAG: SDR family oxidoreductase [Planctomycetes bacterium]|nr:SDR family oxidoreductase [Planctomycetota bacterium]